MNVLEVRDLELVLFSQFVTELGSDKVIAFFRRGRGQFPANVIALNFSVPMLLWRGLPRYLQSVLVHSFNLDAARSTSGS